MLGMKGTYLKVLIPDIFEEIDHKVRVHYGLIEPDEEDIVEEAQVEETSDELVLDLDSTIEIEE